jgi:hypothetical protein
MPGDLTSDGGAEFWGPDLEEYGPDGRIIVTKDLVQRHNAHVRKFYNVLEETGKTSDVFVVKGDHDDDFEGSYDAERINSIKGCHEISGKLLDFAGLTILGLGYYETHYLRTLRHQIQGIKKRVDIILTHAEQRRLLCMSEVSPKIIARGHFGFGVSQIDDVLVVCGRFPNSYSVVEVENGSIKSSDCWSYCGMSQKFERCMRSCRIDQNNLKQREDSVWSKWPWEKQIIQLGCPLNIPFDSRALH